MSVDGNPPIVVLAADHLRRVRAVRKFEPRAARPQGIGVARHEGVQSTRVQKAERQPVAPAKKTAVRIVNALSPASRRLTARIVAVKREGVVFRLLRRKHEIGRAGLLSRLQRQMQHHVIRRIEPTDRLVHIPIARHAPLSELHAVFDIERARVRISLNLHRADAPLEKADADAPLVNRLRRQIRPTGDIALLFIERIDLFHKRIEIGERHLASQIGGDNALAHLGRKNLRRIEIHGTQHEAPLCRRFFRRRLRRFYAAFFRFTPLLHLALQAQPFHLLVLAAQFHAAVGRSAGRRCLHLHPRPHICSEKKSCCQYCKFLPHHCHRLAPVALFKKRS